MKIPAINSNSIYVEGPYYFSKKDGVKRGKMAKLIVRDYKSLSGVVVPFFYGKLHGNKGVQFQEWLEKIGGQDVPYPYREIYNLYKNGYYRKNSIE